MTDIGKFLSDVEKIMKYDRQNNGGKTDYKRTAKDIRKLFERSTNCPGELPGSVFEYWENQYVLNSTDLLWEPSSEKVAKLAAMLSFIDGGDEDRDLISDDDWQELGRLVGYESEELPIDILTSLMTVLVDKKAY